MEPRAGLPAEKAERERSITNNFQRSYGSWRWNGPPIPDTKPPFENVMADEDGRIWVMVPQPSYEWRSATDAEAEEERTGWPALRFRSRTVFDVYEPRGRFLGPVVVPEGFTMFPQPVIRGSAIWAVTRDHLDVARVVRYRLIPAVGR